MSVLTASLVTGGFTALWLVANELEDPFGTDYNDLPMLGYHEVCRLPSCSLDRQPVILVLMDVPTTLLAELLWVDPISPALAR